MWDTGTADASAQVRLEMPMDMEIMCELVARFTRCQSGLRARIAALEDEVSALKFGAENPDPWGTQTIPDETHQALQKKSLEKYKEIWRDTERLAGEVM